MKAVILAAGRGLRLHPLTKQTNKCILRVGNTSTLENMLHLLCDKNIEPVIVTGFDHENVAKIVRKYTGTIIYNKDFKKYEKTIVLSLASAWKTFREYETLYLMGDLFIDNKTLETIINTEANSCLIDKDIRIKDTLVKGRNKKVEKFLSISNNSVFLEENIVGNSLHIFHFKRGTCLSKLLKETFSQRYDRSRTGIVVKLLNEVVKFEGIQYKNNQGYCMNLNTFESLKKVRNYLNDK